MFTFFSNKILRSNIRRFSTFSHHSNTKRVLTPECNEFLHELFDKNIDKYNNTISLRNDVFDKKHYNFRKDTSLIREKNWSINAYDDKLKKRHVEITGPGNDAKMVINALNSKADGYMFDIEDSMSPTWSNVMNAHYNIKKIVDNDLVAEKKDKNGNIIKKYSLNNDIFHPNTPTFHVRTRGLHMMEENYKINNNAMPATIFDIGVHLFHNGSKLNKKNMSPYLYIPKLESYEDACFVNNILIDAQSMLNIPTGTVKVTALIETFPAIFQTEEIIYGLKEHIVGLNCGRWDYLFGMLKCDNENVLEFKNKLTMDKSFLESYVKQIVNSCHKRGIHAIGGMSAFIPTGNKEKDNKIFETIKLDKLLEISRGCDGAWVAHPALIDPVKEVFNNNLPKDNQINSHMPTELINDEISKITKEDLINNTHKTTITEEELRSNINICFQYIAAWLSGNGAVALNNLMEDLATSEISMFQLKQWLCNSNNVKFIRKEDGEELFINTYTIKSIINSEFDNIIINNEIKYAARYFDLSKRVFEEYLYGDYKFLPDVATKYLNIKDGFTGAKWDEKTIQRISGSKGYLSGIELTKHRGEYLNKFLFEEDNIAYKFLGTSNGVSAVNVVAGGKGVVGPYAGGWQHNAMKNRLNMCLPDTLHVSPEESANCAAEINNHLHRADAVQNIQKLDNPDLNTVNYYDMAMLCDLEQGWCTPEKTRIATLLAIQNGINVIHIEDQGEKKRCGHLGDKELNTYDDYALIMRSANLAAQELLGPEQADKQWVRFVARTDALSAKRIHNSQLLYSNLNPENKFIDWEKGTSPDGKYLYLKQGINPETGNSWGLDLSIYRSSRIVDEGLASHVWMETPDADLNVAKAFMDGVNDILLPKGKRAYGLYNHSPSFDWDVKFFAEAELLADKIIEWSKRKIKRIDNINSINPNELHNMLCNEGEIIQGDHLFNDDELDSMCLNIIDYHMTEDKWHDNLKSLSKSNYEGFNSKEIDKYLTKKLQQGFSPKTEISNIIVERRLKEFGNQLASFGCNMHLITLPEFHITAYNMHTLSNDFSDNGINAFVKRTQRPERIHSENDDTYTYYKHQTATGTGVEAAFNQAVGSHDVNILNDSTEQDDIKKRI